MSNRLEKERDRTNVTLKSLATTAKSHYFAAEKKKLFAQFGGKTVMYKSALMCNYAKIDYVTFEEHPVDPLKNHILIKMMGVGPALRVNFKDFFYSETSALMVGVGCIC